MKISINCMILAFALIITSFNVVEAQTVTATVIPSETNPSQGSQVYAAVNIDMSATPELLGAYSASLEWDVSVLEFASVSGGTTAGFDNPNTNQNEVSTGRLLFNQFNTSGANGVVNVINVTFNVIGNPGSSSNLDLEFSALSAAITFTNLLPILTTNDGSITVPGGAGVTAEVVPSETNPSPGSQIDAAVNIDVSAASELLGAYSASLEWDVSVLEFVNVSGGTTAGFDNPNTNQNEVSSGRLLFNQFNTTGANGVVNVINVTFNVIGNAGSSSNLDLEFSALDAANTFTNLLPFLTVHDAVVTIESAQNPVLCVNPDSYQAPSSGGSEVITVTNCGSGGTFIWNVSDDRDWISVSPTSGSPGQTFTVTVDENSTTSSRSGTVTVTAAGVSGSPKVIQVTQEGKPVEPTLCVSPSDWTSPPVQWQGDSKTFTVTNCGSGGTFTWNASDDRDWISVSPTSGNPGQTFTVTVDENSTTSSRSGTVTVTAAGVSGSPKTIPVTQDGVGAGHFTWTETDDYYSVIIEAVTLDGTPIQDGDEIGVFTVDDNGDLFCAGGITWPDKGLKAWADDSQTPEKDGFVSGEDLMFAMWSAGDQEEYGPPSETNYTEGDGKWGTGSYAKINPMRFMRCRETTLNLAQGWSWISLNVYPPDDPNMEVVWQDVNSLVIIKGYSGFYIPGEWNGIGDWDVKQMYVPYLSSPAQLSMCGQPVEPTTPIGLDQNWNWVSYLPNVAIDAEVALTSIVNDLNIAKGYDGFYIPGEWNGIGNMQPGQGYKMHMGQPGTLIYPSGALFLKTTDKEMLSNIARIPSKHYTFSPSAEYQAILIKQVNGDELHVGDEIGAFMETGKCIGAGVYNGSFPIAIMAWADVKDTKEIEGYTSGEKMQFRLWDVSEAKETELFYNTLQGSDKYGETPLNKIELTKQLETIIPTEFSLEQNYPNPFNPETFIRYNIPKASKVKFAIYSINGKLIRVLEDRNKEPGSYQVLWDGRNEFGEKVATGLYFCFIQAGENKAVRKIVMVK